MNRYKEIKNSLLLSRKEKERIVLIVDGKKIIIGLDNISPSRAKIRIHAAKDVEIHREEVYLKENCLFRSNVDGQDMH